MKKFLVKIDLFQFNWVKNFIMFFVVKSKFKKHKYWVLADISKYYIYFLLFALIFLRPIIMILEGETVIISLVASIFWLPFIFIVSTTYFFIVKTAGSYDLIFENRKNPDVYDTIKSFVKTKFENDRPFRLWSYKLNFAMSLFLIAIFVSAIYAVGGYISNIISLVAILSFIWFFYALHDYSIYIFDFDPPDKKKKEAKQSLTDIVRSSWQRVVDNVVDNAQPCG